MSEPPATLLLENEAVQALADVHHRKHRRALAFIKVVNQRNGRRRQPLAVFVPVADRIEAGWDRSAPGSAVLNRISRPRDVILDGHGADRAAQLRYQVGVSVVDATVGHAAAVSPGAVTILASDVADMHRVIDQLGGDIRVVCL